MEKVEVDKTGLDLLIKEAEKYEEGNYTTDSWTALQEALNAAKDVMNDENALESNVESALNNLTDAIGNLVLRADKSRLQGLYDMLSGLDMSQYIESTTVEFTEAMVNIKAILDNPNVTQEEVDDVYKVLLKAYLDLRLKPNKSLLDELINNK